MSELPYPKRLIEVDLPIREISAHARREKSIRHGHISTLHIWWARRPLAACRAVLCAALWPDPADENCPQAFREAAAATLCGFAEKVRTDKALAELCASHWTRWQSTDGARLRAADPASWWDMRYALLDFIADFSNWDSGGNAEFVRVARALTYAARPSDALATTVIDPFAGGGAIPIEALRVGADAFASDLSPVATLLNQLMIEALPRFGSALPAQVRRWSTWVWKDVEQQLARFYPKDADGAAPIAYLWARTIRCEGPQCGVEIPLLRAPWITRKGSRSVALRLRGEKDTKRLVIELLDPAKPADVGSGTVRLGSATCPLCGFTTRVESVRAQLRERHGGAKDARLLCVVTAKHDGAGRSYRLPMQADLEAVQASDAELRARQRAQKGGLSLIPDEPTPADGTGGLGGGYRTRKYGIATYGDFFNSRQALALSTFAESIGRAHREMTKELDEELSRAVTTALGLGLSRLVDRCSAQCRWDPTPTASGIINSFSRQALSMIWDFAEGTPFENKSGGWNPSMEWISLVLEREVGRFPAGRVERASATSSSLPDDSVDAVVTDPPYYDSVPYGELADYFYVWLRRAIGHLHPQLFETALTPKAQECIVNMAAPDVEGVRKDRTFFEATMCQALAEARRVTKPTGIGVVVFAHKSTAGWETQLQAMVDAGWVITASWPIDTEMGNRLRAQNSAALASSVHLVCRPREGEDGVVTAEVGSWRNILSELPKRIHDWMPRLAHEGVVGADAIFACLGPALEIFSRYSRVEKASGETVALREYLEQVWAAVAREALSMMFEGADATGLEEDARLTAMWLWTLGAGANANAIPVSEEDNGAAIDEDDDDGNAKPRPAAGFLLEYDAARKIAQGLGANLEKLTGVVEVTGGKARLLAVSERAKSLFSKEAGTRDEPPTKGKAKPKASKKQLGLFAEVEAAERAGFLGKGGVPKMGETTLDRVHQSMILFGAGRSEALKRFVVDEGAGKDGRYWKLAQSLSALYPSGSEEKRWVDGVLARKKSLGF